MPSGFRRVYTPGWQHEIVPESSPKLRRSSCRQLFAVETPVDSTPGHQREAADGSAPLRICFRATQGPPPLGIDVASPCRPTCASPLGARYTHSVGWEAEQRRSHPSFRWPLSSFCSSANLNGRETGQAPGLWQQLSNAAHVLVFEAG